MGEHFNFLSLIVAAYNIEAYIANCLDSILKADCQEMELLLVLGASKDGTNEICKNYEKRYPGKVNCIFQNGKGLSNARNCGMKKAKGRYVAFIDGDDKVNTKKFIAFILFLKELDQEKEFAVLGNDFYMIDSLGNFLQEKRQIKVCPGKTVGIEYATELIKSKGTYWNAWRYVYKKEYLDNKKRIFAENQNCEDLDFTCRTFLETKRILFCHMPYYEYCPVREDSLTNKKNIKMARDFLEIKKGLEKLCTQKRGTVAEAIKEKLKELLVLSLPDIYEVPKDDKEQCFLWYQRAIQETEKPQNFWIKIIFSLGNGVALKVVAYFLWRLKHVRRMILYKK